MKQAMNFRLSSQAVATLSELEKKLHTSKTAVIEQALSSYASTKLHMNQPLLKFAGILSDDEATEMLTQINTNKHNKDIEISLWIMY